MMRAVLAACSLLLTGCASMNVVSEGPDSRLMLKGYDPVAYFTDGAPVRGRDDLKVEHQGVIYRFASDEHRRLFLANAARYIPQYGGWCANAMAYAIPRPSEPEHFKIVAGRLYVFADARSRQHFEMDQERNLQLADSYWDAEVRDSILHWQYALRAWINRVPHYRSTRQLDEEYERRFGRRPG